VRQFQEFFFSKTKTRQSVALLAVASLEGRLTGLCFRSAKMEVWKQVEGFEDYEISSCGRVRKGDLIMKSYDNGLGYHGIRLRHNHERTRFYIHRLVITAFSPTNDCALEVNHIDHNKANNEIGNLEWVTHKQNLIKAVLALGKGAFRKATT
jgi:hypothetical protein